MLRERENCWRIARASRAAFLIDADAYFTAFRHAGSRARHSVFILGWDIDSRVRLNPGTAEPPLTLLPFLNDILAAQPELRVFALAWDFSVLFTLEREPLPSYRFAWNAHPRLSFHLDDAHPFSASHHQKIVVVDDALAFAGGLDLTIRRWDTPAHHAREPGRVDPTGRPYPPAHDIQMMVEGEAAAALGELARARWHAATGQMPAPPPPALTRAPDLWPEAVVPDLRDAPLGIARTMPAFRGAPAVQEVAAFASQSIASARRYIYIENQYLTSAAVGAALARRLAEADGPEVVIVLPREEHGWLERSSMGIMRARLLRHLYASNHHDRLRLYFPTVPALDGACMNVHAKVMIVDDRTARVGSANLSNRSMGLDSECDLILDADLDPRHGPAIAALRNRLLAEHLDCDPQAIADTLAARGALIPTVEALRGRARSLVPLPEPAGGAAATEASAAPPGPAGSKRTLDLAFLDGLACDPEQPAPDELLSMLVPEGLRPPVRRSLVGWGLVVAAVLALVAVWRLTPLRTLLDVDRVAALGRTLSRHPAAPFAVLGAYLGGTLLFFPITPLLGATALVFPAPLAFAYCLGGALSAAVTTYGIGRLVGRFRPRWLERPRIKRVSRQLRRRGILAVIAARIVPVGNFSLINITAGALGVRFRDYLIGNVIGLLPGVLALTVFADRIGATIRHPHPRNLIVLALVGGAIGGALWWLKRRIARRR
ncbi:MAG TPA: VTT domain-containing protein [Polyangia bacterium]